ncbi:MAG: protein BatD [Chitinophagaceae bacterium]|nr:protein BatD [Chitinophagaceae bacterium]MCO5287736.1 BatD family protein [Chitinophagaceae bacterium]MCZ2395405.1 BatD family protein [Chitinophagales bacterium]
MKRALLYFLPKITLLLVLTWMSSSTVRAQKFSAISNESKIGKNDIFQVEFRLENASGTITPPEFKGFEVMNGPMQESQITSVNGAITRQQSLKYILHPVKPGKFTIPPATASVNGKELKSNSLHITVLDVKSVAPTPPPPPASSLGFGIVPGIREGSGLKDFILSPNEDPVEKIKKNIFIRMESDKTECYEGQPVVVSFKLYTRLRSETNITSAPSFNGFSVTDMDVPGIPTEEKVNGKSYNCHLLRKVQIFPMRAGTFELTPIELSNKVTFIKDEGANSAVTNYLLQMLQDFADDNLPADQTVTQTANLKSNALTIHVKPLPAERVPPAFKGAVGHFSIESALQNEHLTTDDAGNLLVTISGEGNLSLITCPDIRWEKGIEAYDAKINEQTDKNKVPISGYKTFNIPFTINKAGEYHIPPITFSWFDPTSGKYQTASTEPISFNVSRGKGFTAATHLKPKEAPNLLSDSLSKIGLIILAMGILFLLTLAVIRRRNRHHNYTANKTQINSTAPEVPFKAEIPAHPLDKIPYLMDSASTEDFYKSLEQSLKDYLSSKLKIPPHEYSRQAVLERMDQCNVGIGSTQLFESLMNDLELGLYAKNFHTGQKAALYEKTEELVSLLNKQIC